MKKENLKLPIKLQQYCSLLEVEFDQITTARRAQLTLLGQYISNKLETKTEAQLIAICTHNSRRSHMAQLWLAIGATYFQLPNIKTYSGGTEATCFHPNAIEAFQRIGLTIDSNEEKQNPTYAIKWTQEMPPYFAFSKHYQDAPNPSTEFAAIMVCSDADTGCPLVRGCDFRLALPFADPKVYDASDQVAEAYDNSLKQIGREMMFALSIVKQ